MSRRGQRAILGGLLLAASLLLLAVLLHFRSPGRTASAVDRAASAYSEPTVDRVDSSVDAAKNAPVPTPKREVLADGSAAASVPGRVVFRFDDGSPAAGLSLYRADVVKTVYPQAIREGAPNWNYRLGSAGELVLDGKVDLGSIVAVRLSDIAVELVPLDLTRVR